MEPLYPHNCTQMKVVIQRVSSASVTVDNRVTGKIKDGFLLLVGIHNSDTLKKVEWVCNKIVKLRVFEDDEGKMNRSIRDVGGDLLVVSQFTLYGDVSRGTRPGFSEAAPPEMAEPLYEQMLQLLEENMNKPVQSGVFGAMMDVELVNSGPVTIILEKE